MYYLCRHIMPNGARCQSPALLDKPYCYFHHRLHRLSKVPAPKAGEGLKIPVIEDRCAVQLAVAQVLDALGSSRLDPRRAGLYLYGIQLASQNVNRNAAIRTLYPVESMSQTRNGEDMAPERFVCDPPRRCETCGYYDRCPLIPDDDEEEEEEDEGEGEEDNQDETADTTPDATKDTTAASDATQ
jgi:hypothetical protein